MFVTQHALLRLTFAQNCVNLKDHYKIVGLNRQALKFVHALNNYTHEAIILTVQLGLTQISVRLLTLYIGPGPLPQVFLVQDHPLNLAVNQHIVIKLPSLSYKLLRLIEALVMDVNSHLSKVQSKYILLHQDFLE